MRHTTDAALAARQIRAMLKDHGITATVKSKSYSMGSSVDIDAEDLPPWTARAIKLAIEPYEYGTFDGMTDTSGLKNQEFNGPQAKFVFLNNQPSDGKRAEIWAIVRARLAGFEDSPEDHKQAWNFCADSGLRGDMLISKIYSDISNSYGIWHKPRIKAA